MTDLMRALRLSLETRMPLDADGDCCACGHHPFRHGLSGCHERVNDLFGDEERCDCEVERLPGSAKAS